MVFTTRAVEATQFDQWVAMVRSSPKALSLSAYRDLEKPTVKVPVAYYGAIDPVVYHHALNQCADGAPCMDDMMSRAAAADTLGLGDRAFCDLVSLKGH